MQRSARLIVAVFALAAACSQGAEASDPTTTTSPATPSSSTTTAAVAASTTTSTTADPEAAGPEILNVLTSLVPGNAYIHEGMGVPFTITPQLDGRAVEEIGDAFVQLKNDSPDAGPGVVATVMLFMANDSIDTLIDVYTDSSMVDEATDAKTTTVGGIDGTSIDVLVPPDLDNTETKPRNLSGDPECTLLAELFVEQIDRLGWPFSLDFVGCAWNRIWLVNISGATMTLTVGPDVRTKEEINELNELGPYVDDFISAITFCIEATPCDD